MGQVERHCERPSWNVPERLSARAENAAERSRTSNVPELKEAEHLGTFPLLSGRAKDIRGGQRLSDSTSLPATLMLGRALSMLCLAAL